MSVTFWMQQAPLERVQPYEDEPDYFTQQPVAPFTEVNLANSNAIALVEQIDPKSVHRYEDGVDVYGEWDMLKLIMVEGRLRALQTMYQKREQLILDPFVSQQPGQCTMHHGGRDHDYIERLVERMLELVRVAREHEFPVTFG